MAYTHHNTDSSNSSTANLNLNPHSPGGTTLTLPLTDMLRKFCSFFDVSGEDMSAYFAVFESDKNSPSSINREHALRSSVVDLTLSERVLRLLYLNSDLLKFEYGRCLSRFLTSPDPIMEGALVPLSTVETRPRDTLLPLDCAFRFQIFFILFYVFVLSNSYLRKYCWLSKVFIFKFHILGGKV